MRLGDLDRPFIEGHSIKGFPQIVSADWEARVEDYTFRDSYDVIPDLRLAWNPSHAALFPGLVVHSQ